MEIYIKWEKKQNRVMKSSLSQILSIISDFPEKDNAVDLINKAFSDNI